MVMHRPGPWSPDGQLEHDDIMRLNKQRLLSL